MVRQKDNSSSTGGAARPADALSWRTLKARILLQRRTWHLSNA